MLLKERQMNPEQQIMASREFVFDCCKSESVHSSRNWSLEAVFQLYYKSLVLQKARFVDRIIG